MIFPNNSIIWGSCSSFPNKSFNEIIFTENFIAYST